MVLLKEKEVGEHKEKKLDWRCLLLKHQTKLINLIFLEGFDEQIVFALFWRQKN